MATLAMTPFMTLRSHARRVCAHRARAFERRTISLYVAAALASVGVLQGCASLGAAPLPESDASSPPRAAAPAPAAAAPSAAPVPGALKPFADVVKDAQHDTGLFGVWRKEDKVWLEIAPEQFDKPYLLTASRTRALGERGFYTNWMLDEHIVSFKRVGNTVQLIARNERYLADDKAPLATAVRASFTDSLLGSGPVVSQPHPERKTVLVEFNPILLSDVPGFSTQLEARFRLPYAFDAKNSYFGKITSTERQTSVEVTAHYAIPKLPAPPATMPPPGTPLPTPPRNIVDGRSMLIGYLYSFAALPETPMAIRAADDRVGHFVSPLWDYANEATTDPRRYAVNRWRLDKQDPAAALSPPVKPIVFWLDRNIPPRYREAVRAGILEWNLAFERIGFKNAIEVQQQPDDADFDLADATHASVRWFVDTDDGALAIGPSHTDPRTGEILDADIGISDNWVRLTRRVASEQFPKPRAASAGVDPAHTHGPECNHAAEAMEEVGFALDVLQARGHLEPGSPEAEAVVLAVLKDVVTHEVGHTLGLRHNFRASTTIPISKIQDAAYTRAHGLSGSVMDYNAFNVALENEVQGEYAMSTLGAYDYWAIEYAYKPLSDEARELAAIAARSTEPALAYGTDEEAGGPFAYDPEVNMRDLGDDPLGFAQRRVALSRELWRRLQDNPLKDGESYAVRRRSFVSGLRQVGVAVDLAAKHIGGIVYLRDHAGSPRASFTPVPAARQRQALALITRDVLAANAFAFKPEFLARLPQDGLERGYNPPQPVALNQMVFELQKQALDRLLADPVAQRVLEAPAQMSPPQQALSLSELHTQVRQALWSELDTGRDIALQRRNLQREHVRKLAQMLLRPTTGAPADIRAVARTQAQALIQRIKPATTARALSDDARAHLNESIATLQEALNAPLQRAGA